MTWWTLILAGFATPGAAQDYPHRDWGQVVTLDMTMADATACIAREMDRHGSVLVLPVEGGADIDFSVDVMWGKQLDPWERFKLRTEEGKTVLRVFYRKPTGPKSVGKDVERLRKRCLVIREMRPVLPE